MYCVKIISNILSLFLLQRQNADNFGMQTVSVIRQMKEGEKVRVHNAYSSSVLRNNKSEKNIQFMGWLLKTPEPNVIFDGSLVGKQRTNGPITYTDAYANLGNGLKIDDGSFIAPVSGIYYLHFQGLTDTSEANLINIKQNGQIVSSSFRNKRDVSLQMISNMPKITSSMISLNVG